MVVMLKMKLSSDDISHHLLHTKGLIGQARLEGFTPPTAYT